MYADLNIVDVKKIQAESRTDSEAELKCGGWNVRRLLECGEGREEAGSSEAKVGGCPRDVAVYRIDVPEFGTYKVEVAITAGKEGVKNLALFAGRRNLIDYRVNIDAGKEYTRSFYQAVTPYIPALCSERCNDKCIFVSFAGDAKFLSDLETSGNNDCDTEAGHASLIISVTRQDVPIIWVAGDSTLTDQNAGIPYYPYGSCAGWAQTLQRFIDGAAVCNLAHSGMTTNCFKDDGHYDIVKEMIKPGDLFIMQFGHNDQKRRNLAAFGGYADNLRRYVKEVRELGAETIICSPISRIPNELPETKEAPKKDGARNIKYYSLLKSHAEACREVAKELGTTFIDLHKMTFDKWMSDIDESHDFFMPGDITHTNEYGAVLISEYFIEKIRTTSQSSPGAKQISQFDNHRQFAALLPDSDTKTLPKELPGPDIFSIEPPYVDIKGIPEYEGIKKAFRLGLLDPCVMYLHPYAPMPRAQLLMPLFRAFGKAGIRPYKGQFSDISFDEWDSGYVQALVDMGISKGEKFRPDDPVTYDEFARIILEFAAFDKESFGEYLNVSVGSEMEQDTIMVEKLGVRKRADRPVHVKEPYGIAGNNCISRAEVYTALAGIMEMRGNAAKELPSDSEVHPVH
jgi:lysophospholipase L1-like esterase